jgi:hypothetical protein
MALISSDRLRFPCEPWKLVENIHVPGDEGSLETLFALGNGHLGIRGSHSTAGDGELPGTFINGFHEIWDIKHAENAFGFARTGQRILYIPDANNFTVVIDGEALSLANPGAGLPAAWTFPPASTNAASRGLPFRRYRHHHRAPRRRLRFPWMSRLRWTCRGPGRLRGRHFVA